MSFDAREMIDVNLPLMKEAAKAEGEETPLVVSVATWGRGIRQELLQALEPYRHGLGFNGSVVARVPRQLASELFRLPHLQEVQQRVGWFQGLGVVFKETHLEWLEK